MQFGDFNGDGKLDYAWIPQGVGFWLIAYGTDTGFTLPDPTKPALPASIGGYALYNNMPQYIQLRHLNGDGKLDYAWIPQGVGFWLTASGPHTGFTLPDPTKPALPASIGGYPSYNFILKNRQPASSTRFPNPTLARSPQGVGFWLIAYGTDTGFTVPDPTKPALPASIGGYLSYNNSPQYMHFGDFNGDGKLDYAWIPQGVGFWLIAYGTGTGFTTPNPANPALP